MSEQRSTHEGPEQPSRLLDTDAPTARVLAAFDARTKIGDSDADGDEDRAWRRLRQQLRAGDDPAARQGKGLRLMAVAGAAAGLIVIVALTAGQNRRPAQQPTALAVPESTRAKPSSVDSSAPAPAIAVPAAPPASLPLPGVPRPLPSDRVRLDEHIAVIAAPGTKASSWVDRAGQQHVDLASGVVQLIVSGGVHPTLVVPAARSWSLSDGWVKGAFVDPLLELAPCVRQPAPASASGRQAAVDSPVAGPETPVVATPGVRRRSLSDCRALEQQERDDEAQTCLRALAEGNDLNAETALYELARLQQESLGDTTAALATLRKQRRRFPAGALRDEAELTTIELLPQVGQYRSALELSEAFLARHPRHERAAELHLLRANILREVFADYAAAVREYQEIDAGAGGVADDAAFFLAVSLESDGRKQDAADAYRRYLTRGAPAHAAVARVRLAALTPR